MYSIGLRVSFETYVCKLKKAALHKLRNAAKFPKLRGVKVAGNLSEGKKRGTVTDIPVGSRTTVPELTQMGLTSGFGMGPGKHHRYDRAPIFLRIGSGCDPAFGSLLKLA